MQMDPGRTTGTPHQGNLLALIDQGAHIHQQLGVVGIAGHQTIAMVYLHHVAKLRVAACPADDPLAGCQDGSAGLATNIHSLVHLGATVERIDPPTETGGDPDTLLLDR